MPWEYVICVEKQELYITHSSASEDSGVPITKVGQFGLHKRNFSQISFVTAPETHMGASKYQTQMH